MLVVNAYFCVRTVATFKYNEFNLTSSVIAWAFASMATIVGSGFFLFWITESFMVAGFPAVLVARWS